MSSTGEGMQKCDNVMSSDARNGASGVDVGERVDPLELVAHPAEVAVDRGLDNRAFEREEGAHDDIGAFGEPAAIVLDPERDVDVLLIDMLTSNQPVGREHGHAPLLEPPSKVDPGPEDVLSVADAQSRIEELVAIEMRRERVEEERDAGAGHHLPVRGACLVGERGGSAISRSHVPSFQNAFPWSQRLFRCSTSRTVSAQAQSPGSSYTVNSPSSASRSSGPRSRSHVSSVVR